MKRLTLLLLGLALGVASTASAQGLTMQMSNGWSFSFSGNVNAFWVFTKGTNSGPTNSSVRTGLLPAFATFSASGKEAGLNLGVHFGFAPQINNAGVHDQFGAQIDMRQVYLTIGFKDGSQILAGRELGVFSRQNILNDMTLFGVGAVGIAAPGLGAGAQGGGTTLGRIGYGYLYPNFVPQVTYSTKPGQAQLSIGLFQPSIFGQGTGTNAASAAYVFTSIPRVEAEVTYNQKSGRNSYLLWAGGLWQTTKNAVTGGNSATSFGGTAGIKAGLSELSIVVSGYIGTGLGTTLMFSGQEVAPSGTDLRKSDGGYAQLMYKVGPKTNLGASWGFSRLKNASAGETAASGGNNSVRTQWNLATVGIYHQWTKSLKLVFEGSREQEGIGAAAPAQVDISGGFMLFY
ncbi:MAG: hypothetical protein DMD33_11225 [Gemmatimonadetes bacterium]|nr:MAG: hypothetical protein DMD33_11225 [Gemmatimonadota bacterium]PYO98871.1 MAG: hypothetical protein DMD61_08895 [Gemmatimonadota bacterium]TLY55950.1 MAG: hypothetical protein E6K55_02080 [Gemmatimonadota bacterium]